MVGFGAIRPRRRAEARRGEQAPQGLFLAWEDGPVGKANRLRRTAKQKQKQKRAQRPAAAGFSAASSPSLRDRAEQHVMAAIDHLACSEHEECALQAEQAISALAAERGELWSEAVDAAIFGLHMRVLGDKCWPEGWQPADLARSAGRELGAGARRAVVDLMAAQLRAYAPASIDERWHDQLAELGAKLWWKTDADYVDSLADERNLGRAQAVRLLVRLLGLLARLPRIEQLGPLPGTARSTGVGARRAGSDAAASEKLLARVRALLAKAEATSFPAEAETFTTAAQAMMARHSIDEAMLRSGPGQGEDRPGGIRVGVDNPYPDAKALLLQQIAEANRCRAVWSRHLGFSTVLGFDADVRWVELLYTSLLVQATAAMTGAGSKTDAWGGSRTRSFRASFLQSFAVRIGERLGETTAQAEAEASRDGGRDLLPVLASRRRAVDEEMVRIFPEMTRSTRRATYAGDREGWMSGRAAADLANLSQRSAVGQTS
jgi:hypothetical protein